MSGVLNALAVLIAEEGRGADASGFIDAVHQAIDGKVNVHALIVGAASPERHAEVVARAGVASLVLASHPLLALPVQVEQLLAVLAPFMQTMAADIVLLHADSVGDELAARLAMRMGGAALGRCTALNRSETGWVARKPAYGGRMEAVVEAGPGPCFAVLHAAAPRAAAGSSATDTAVRREALTSALPDVRHIRHAPLAGGRKRVEGAHIVVCGGRGMGGSEGFVQLQALADELGAALGGSLPAVDAGWVPVSHQIGQSGKYVTPATYVAVGLSGTPQHMAGVSPQTRIVAINNDEAADIFRVAMAGAVADWKELLPVLIGKLRQMRAGTGSSDG